MASACAALNGTTSPYYMRFYNSTDDKATVNTVATDTSCVVFDIVYDTLSEGAARYGGESVM